MEHYYSDRLSAKRLMNCYEIAPSRIKQYLDAEIAHVLTHVDSNDRVLELGCGYGRFLAGLVGHVKEVVGIDVSLASLRLANEIGLRIPELIQMNAVTLGFTSHAFDVVACIQNGISAFNEDPKQILMESIRVTKKGGVCLFSSYSDKIWSERLEWFHLQASEGLIGEIDLEKTGNGCIVCKDGFQATTFRREDFSKLVFRIGVTATIAEVDESSIFCEIRV